MSNPITNIHIVWSGPFAFEKISEFVSYTDFGIYQIYGSHPAYGSDVLLYLGRCQGGSFGWRIPQHEWWLDNHDDGRIRVYLGKLAGESTPAGDVWNHHIALAERLLIYAHQPAVNQRSGLGNMDAELQNVHICNWGRRADLLPEVSGLRWTSSRNAIPLNPYSDDPEVAAAGLAAGPIDLQLSKDGSWEGQPGTVPERFEQARDLADGVQVAADALVEVS